MRKFLLTIILIIVAVCNCAFAMKVKMLNVGQGDAVLIQTGEQNVLVDTSDADERDKLRLELYKADCYTLDKVILTHAHADHIGNAAWLIKNGVFTVRSVYDNGKISANKYYREYLALCGEMNVPRITARAGDVIDLGGGATFTVLSSGAGVRNVNDDSIVGMVTLGNFKMLLTGDAERLIEEELCEGDIEAVVLKAGHHGSKTSNSFDFVSAVNPRYVVISAGEPTSRRGGNTYGHPHKTSLENFLLAGVDRANIYWTWRNGTVTVETDGEEVRVTPEVEDVWVDEYLGYRLTIRQIG